MREDYGNMSSLVEQEEGFGDMEFGTDGPDILRHASRLEQSLDQVGTIISEFCFNWLITCINPYILKGNVDVIVYDRGVHIGTTTLFQIYL